MSLAAVSEACTDALAAIGTTDRESAPLHFVLVDIDALLALIYTAATKLVLTAPNPPIALLADLAHHTPALAHCTRLLHDDTHGVALTKDVRSRTRDIVDALRALAESLLSDAPRQEYLVKTATLHHLITDARSTSGIPKDNQAAVYRAWKLDRDSLEDNLHEINTMIKDAQSDRPADQFDDGWDDIGLGHPTSMDEHELARAKNVHQLLRLTTLLHKRVLLDLLAHPSPAPVSAFDALLAQSNLLLATSDDLVAALYSPHDPPYVRQQILDLAQIVSTLQTHLAVFFPATDDLANHLRALTVDDRTPSSPTKKKADKKWFDTCVDQILRVSSTAAESSGPSIT